MKFESIEFKNIFAYGEAVQRIDYDDCGKLILLKGQSGAGKSAILQLPVLSLYGKVEKMPKDGVANRINKHGWIRATIVKGNDRYVIEREFSPNNVKVWKNDEMVDAYGVKAAQDYIDREIVEMPMSSFTNMITISMKKFKSFLTMTPSDRRQIVDRIFDLDVVNMVFETVKKDARELGNSINGDNASIFSLNQTIANANAELVKIQEKNASDEDKKKIEENNAEIEKLNDDMVKLNEATQKLYQMQNDLILEINSKKSEIFEVESVLRQIQEKKNLFNQSKCPTCGTPFVGDFFDTVKEKIIELEKVRNIDKERLISELNEKNERYTVVVDKYNQVSSMITDRRLAINNLNNANLLINQKLQSSGEYQAVANIIQQTTEQLNALNEGIEKKQNEMFHLQALIKIFSIDGVKQLVINDYLPLLNQEIAENLIMLNFPYILEFDSQFDPHIKDLGKEISVETLSDGEMTRVDLVILCSLFKILKRKYPSINILSLDESVSTLDNVTSGAVLSFLNNFAMENNLNCFIVSHTELYLENFEKIFSVEKVNGFSTLTKQEIGF